MLIAEDDGSTAEHLARIFQLYRDHLSVTVVTNVGDAIGAINENRPDILLLDLMMPYGQAAAELGEESDPDWMYTGLRLLRRIREQEKGGAHPIWVGVITARNSPGTMQELRQLLGTEGRLYPKPFNDIRLEHEIVSTFGIPSKVPPQLLRDVEDW